MSFRLREFYRVIVMCDLCGAHAPLDLESGEGDPGISREIATKAAALLPDGWVHMQHKHLCPACVRSIK